MRYVGTSAGADDNNSHHLNSHGDYVLEVNHYFNCIHRTYLKNLRTAE